MQSILFVTLLFGAAFAAPLDKDAPIESQVSDISPDGSFQQSWSGNGIAVQEQGALKNAGQKDEAQVIQGSASWVAPDGTVVQSSWTADENGARFEGTHLPVAPVGPEIPPQIARALAYIAAHPYKEPEVYKKL